MQIELNVGSGQPVESDNGPKGTGIGPGLWLITMILNVSVDASSSPGPCVAYVGFTGLQSQLSENIIVSANAEPGTAAMNEATFFARLIVVTVPDLQLYCESSPGSLAGGYAIICAEKIG